jgi:chromosome segregation ATPase
VREESGIEKGESKYIKDGKVRAMKTPTGNKKVDGKPSIGKPIVEEDFEKEAKEIESEKLKAAIDMLRQDNEDLADKLAIAAMDADDLDKAMAESTIKDLRAQIRLLEIELRAVTDSRDSLQRENAQLMRQCNSLVKKLKAT